MTSREDRQPDPAVDRDRAIAALIYCAKKHPEQRLGQLVENATSRSNDATVHHGLFYATDDALAAAFHSYAKEPA